MASNVKRDHHLLTRNLKLNDNYISNDGDNEGISITDAGNVGIGSTIVAPNNKLEVFNANVQLDGGTTGYAASNLAVSTANDFTTAMIGGRFIFDDGTDMGLITSFINAGILGIESDATVGSSGDLRDFKIYYPSVQVKIEASDTKLMVGATTISKKEITFSGFQDFTVDAVGDIDLSADGGNITMNDGTSTVFDFNVDEPALKIMDDADANDYFQIAVGANGATDITTVDSAGTDANITIQPDGSLNLISGGDLVLYPIGGSVSMPISTLASAGSDDAAFKITQTLNDSSAAGGTQAYYGIKFTLTQTDVTGWDSVYMQYLNGGTDKVFSIDNSANVSLDGTLMVKDKVKFTQDDGNEFIDSQADGYLDLGATTAIRLEAPTLCEDKLYFTQTDGNEYIDSLGDGYLDIDATTSIRLKSDVELTETNKLYFDGGGDTYMVSSAGDVLDIVVGGVMVVRSTEGLNGQRDWKFRDSAVGFDQDTATYDATNTTIDFRLGNKVIVTFDSGSITNLNCTFPAVSGNFLVLIKQDASGSRTITNYKAFDSAGSSAGGSGAVKFAGGSNPTLTTDANHVDIISFYWDATNEIAYGVPTLDFQF
jgi:hypothetical protein